MLENVAKIAKVPKRLVERMTDRDVQGEALSDVAEGEGKILEIEGEKLAVARLDGQIYIVNPTCTHMGCTVSWNGAERSWDCPCHGSRFDPSGLVLNGPAARDLERKEARRSRAS
jgi:Rieske Fe-S protein